MRRIAAVVLGLSLLISGCTSVSDGTAVAGKDLGKAPKLLTVDELEDLLLSTSDLNDIMDATKLEVKNSGDKLFADKDDSDGCLGVWGILLKDFYAGSGWVAIKSQIVRQLNNADWKHSIFQSVVMFPTAEAANTFIGNSREKFEKCADRDVTTVPIDAGDKGVTWALGEVKDANDILNISETQEGGNGYSCQRSLGVRSNVVMDIRACGYDVTDQGTKIADKIAENITADK